MFKPFLFDVTMPLLFIIERCWDIFTCVRPLLSTSLDTVSSPSLKRFKISNLTQLENTLHISACIWYNSFFIYIRIFEYIYKDIFFWLFIALSTNNQKLYLHQLQELI